MAKLAYFALFAAIAAYAAGCSRSSLTYVSDGGATVCSSLTPGQCASDARCEQRTGCCGALFCVLKGTPVSTTPCPSCVPIPCSGLDEATCQATPGCRADYCSECACTPSFVGCKQTSDPPSTCPVFKCPVMQCDCHGLNEQSCIADEKTLGCTPFYCPSCGAGQTFSQCLGPNEGAPACTQVCPSTCRKTNDCGSAGICFAPGAPVCGGACQIGCNVDGDCSAGQLCELNPCTCGGTSGKTCQPPCTANSCSPGEVCLSDGHCAPTPCSSTQQCPAWYDCVFPSGPGSPTCQRRACTGDGDCGAGGYCVDGGCYGTLGSCALPPP
jgi:hypothetical protein